MGFVVTVFVILMTLLCIFGVGVLCDYFAGVPDASDGTLVLGLICTAVGGAYN